MDKPYLLHTRLGLKKIFFFAVVVEYLSDFHQVQGTDLKTLRDL